MTLKELLGDAYKDRMTLEEIEEALKTLEAQGDDKTKSMIEKSRFDEVASQLAARNKELKALKESQMTAEEQLAQKVKEAEEAKVGFQREMAKLRAKEVFVGAGLSDKEYSPLLNSIDATDEESARKTAEAITKLIKSKADEREQVVKAELLKSTPQPAGGASATAVTLEQFEKMTWQERVSLKAEQPELFEELQNQESGGN